MKVVGIYPPNSKIMLRKMVLEVVKPGWVDGEDFPIFSVDIHPQGNKFATGNPGGESSKPWSGQFQTHVTTDPTSVYVE